MNNVYENNMRFVPFLKFLDKYKKIIVAIFILVILAITFFIVSNQIEKQNNEEASVIYSEWLEELSNENPNLDNLNTILNQLLEDYKKYYIAHGLDKESSDLESAFLREKNMLEDNKKSIFLLKNNVQLTLNKERESINQLENILRKERKMFKTNTNKEEALRGLDDAALQMLDDKNVAYNKRLITIFNVVIGIIATGVLIYKVPRGEHIL